MRFADLITTGRGMIHVDIDRDIRNTVLLSGVPRGGTTWISEIINHQNDYRYIFEPFHNENVRLFDEFDSNQYISPSETDPHLLSKVHKVLSGRITHPWMDRFNRKIICNKRLIKDVRANLFLKWLKEHFPDLRIVMILRHPFAVAYSRMRLGWTTNLKSFYKQSGLMGDFLSPFMSQITKSTSEFEKQVSTWCIQHYVPLMQFRGTSGLYIGFYEEFCLNVVKETKALLRWLNQDYVGISEERLRRPSRMSYQDSPLRVGENPVRWWTKHITRSELTRGIELLSVFGLNEVYGQGFLPNKTFSNL